MKILVLDKEVSHLRIIIEIIEEVGIKIVAVFKGEWNEITRLWDSDAWTFA